MALVQKSASWKGFSKLEYLIVFGDSYSDVGYSPDESQPDDIEPLGIAFPGITFADGANWVGYLATEYSQSTLRVFDYAKGGETTHNLRYHFEREFLPQLGDKPEFAPWGRRNSLFITWIGINDLGTPVPVDLDPAMERIVALQGRLYETGARNFLLLNVPPIHRCPGGAASPIRVYAHAEMPLVPSSLGDSWKGRYEGWNAALDAALSGFASTHPDATVFMFSAWDTFTRILDDPVAHGFKKSDPRRRGGAIWVDHLHPTSAVHGIMAEELAKFLAFHGDQVT